MSDPITIMNDLGPRIEGRLTRELIDIFTQLQNRFSADQIARVYSLEGIEGVINLLSLMEDTIEGSLANRLDRVLSEAAIASLALVPVESIVGDRRIWFDPIGELFSTEISRYRLDLAREIAGNTRIAIRNALDEGVLAGLNPTRQASVFRDSLNLTPKLQKALFNFRRGLTEGDSAELRELLRRRLRDRRFDSTIRRLIEEGTPIPADKIDDMVNAYKRKALRFRAETIAKTESLTAISLAQHHVFEQNIARGIINPDFLRGFWIFTKDELTRAHHREIPNLNPDGIRWGETFITPFGPMRFPRDPEGSAENRINCRCRVAWRIQ